MSASSCPFDVILAEDLWSPNPQDSLHCKHTCPDNRQDLLFSLGYANAQMQNLFSLSFPSFLVILSCLRLLSCLSPSLHLPQSSEWPVSVSCLSFLVPLFLLFSVSVSVWCPDAFCFLLTVYRITLSTFHYHPLRSALSRCLWLAAGVHDRMHHLVQRHLIY